MQLQRTPEQIKEHYEIEKELADRLRYSPRQERQKLYTAVYDELFRRVPHHPQLLRKSSPQESFKKLGHQIRNLKPFLNKGSVFLEIGAGDCALTIEIAKLVKQAYAIDVSEEITRNLNAPANFKLILSDGSSIPVPAGSIDVAYSNQLMEHLHPDDALEQLQNVYQALAPGGIYFCVTPNGIRGPHDVSRYFDKVATGFHLKEYTVTELDNLFKAVGFSKVRVFIRIKTMVILLPTLPVRICEKLLVMLPHGLKKSLSNSFPGALLLGIMLIGKK